MGVSVVNSTAYIQQYVLEKLRFQHQQSNLDPALYGVSVEVYADKLSKQIISKIQYDILGQKNHRRYYTEFFTPKNWWQHFKQDCFPKWLLSKFPVKTEHFVRSIEFDHVVLLPEMRINLPSDHGRQVIYTPPVIAPDWREG